jgi:hypothetical protein
VRERVLPLELKEVAPSAALNRYEIDSLDPYGKGGGKRQSHYGQQKRCYQVRRSSLVSFYPHLANISMYSQISGTGRSNPNFES